MRQLAARWRAPSEALAEPERVSSARSLFPEVSGELRTIDEGLFTPDFPVDVVYTWVDLADSDLKSELANLPAEANREAITDPTRWTCHDELRFSLRSIELYAPWTNKIFVVTNGQRPDWLADHPKITMIDHSEILEPEYLPTYNSHVIESALHRIPGLAEHYIYFNDDVMLLRPAEPTHFFTANGLGLAFLGSVLMPPGPPLGEETATNWAAKNSRNMVLKRGERAPDLRLAHMCHPQVKSVALESERIFADTYHNFRKNRLRAINDVLVSSYLNQCVGYHMGKMLYARTPYWYLLIRRSETKSLYDVILSQKGTPLARLTACVNDHPVGPNESAEEDLISFMERYFPVRSAFEQGSD